jgi:lipopolysaccharide/colanic/teichoic acid biosynthesis glycosyltransferase
MAVSVGPGSWQSLEKVLDNQSLVRSAGSAREIHAMQNAQADADLVDQQVPQLRSLSFGECLAKRLVDILGSGFAMLLLAPVLLAIALTIWCIDGRPILYTWRVVGKDGVPFTSWKFRTMVVDADRLKPTLEGRNEMQGPVFKMRNDPRVTKIGRILRRLSLDELPQLWSVMKGDMSLVGPRPPLVAEYERFHPWHKQKLSVIPGMTCLWQVRGRNEIKEFDEWVRMDLQYIQEWSLWVDFKIMLRTLKVVLAGRGAY